MSGPRIVGAAAEGEGAGDVTYAIDTTTYGTAVSDLDLLLLPIETAAESVTWPVGWALAVGDNGQSAASTVGTAGASTATAVYLGYKVALRRTCTAATTDIITCVDHKLQAGGAVRFTTTTTLPTGLVAGTTYYATAGTITADTFKVSDTLAHALAGTNIVDITSTGSGTHTVLDAPVLIVDVGDHQIGQLFNVVDYDRHSIFGPCAVSNTTSSTATVTAPAVTTANPGCGVLAFAAGSLDSATWQGNTGAWTNANVTWDTALIPGFASASGNGGQFWGILGVNATPGNIGTSTQAWGTAMAEQAFLTIVINPPRPWLRGSTAPVSGLSTTSPAATLIGDMVVCVTWERAGAGSPTHTLQSGFTEIRTHAHDDGSTDGRLSVAYKVATADGANVYAAYTTSGSGTVYTACYVLKKGTFSKTGILSNSVTDTTSAAPNAPAVTSHTGDYFHVSIVAWHLSTAATVTTTVPSNTPALVKLWDIAGSADVELAAAYLQAGEEANSTIDIGAWTDNVTPNGSCAMSISIPAVFEGTGSAAGTSTAAAVGVSSASVGAADGTSTATAVGASTAEAAGSSTAVATATATGLATSVATGAAAGIATATAVGAATAVGVGASAGTSTAATVGESTATAAGASSGVATATATGEAIAVGVGSAAGVATATATGESTAVGTGAAAGTSTASAEAVVGDSVGFAAGTSTAAAIGESAAVAVGASAGSGTAAAVGESTAVGVGAAAGSSTATAVGAPLGIGVGSATGSSAATAEGSNIAEAVGAAAGTSTATAEGETDQSTGIATGTSTATAIGSSVAVAVGSAAGTSTAAAYELIVSTGGFVPGAALPKAKNKQPKFKTPKPVVQIYVRLANVVVRDGRDLELPTIATVAPKPSPRAVFFVFADTVVRGGAVTDLPAIESRVDSPERVDSTTITIGAVDARAESTATIDAQTLTQQAPAIVAPVLLVLAVVDCIGDSNAEIEARKIALGEAAGVGGATTAIEADATCSGAVYATAESEAWIYTDGPIAEVYPRGESTVALSAIAPATAATRPAGEAAAMLAARTVAMGNSNATAGSVIYLDAHRTETPEASFRRLSAQLGAPVGVILPFPEPRAEPRADVAPAVHHVVSRVLVRAKSGVGHDHRRRKPPRVRPPTLIEADYAKRIIGILHAQRAMLEPVLAEVPQLVASAHGIRLDAGEGRRVRMLLDMVRDRMGGEAKRVAERASGDIAYRVSIHGLAELARQTQAAIGMELTFRDAKLPEAIEHFVHENVALIKRLESNALADVEQLVLRAVADPDLARQLSTDLVARYAVHENHARLIASDQVTTLAAKLARQRHQEIGVTRFKWRTMRDSRVRPTHAHREGKIYSYTGEGKPPEFPGQAVRCRCYEEAIFDELMDLIRSARG